MVLHTLRPRHASNVINLKTRRPIHPADTAAWAQFDRQRSAHNDRLAELVVEAENVLIEIGLDLVKIEEGADATDAESVMIRKALVRRAGAAVLRFRQGGALVKVGGAS